LGYKTPVEKVKDWYEKDRKLFKDNFDIDSYNLSQPDKNPTRQGIKKTEFFKSSVFCFSFR